MIHSPIPMDHMFHGLSRRYRYLHTHAAGASYRRASPRSSGFSPVLLPRALQGMRYPLDFRVVRHVFL